MNPLNPGDVNGTTGGGSAFIPASVSHGHGRGNPSSSSSPTPSSSSFPLSENRLPPKQYERIVSDKAKQCLDALARSTQSSLEMRKKAMRDAFLKEQAEEQIRILQQRLQVQAKESAPELSKILELADGVSRSLITVSFQGD